MLAGEHPLRAVKTELMLHEQCEELWLNLLSEAEVGYYLSRRFVDDDATELLSRVAPLIHARTEGNPLFMVNMVDYVSEQGRLMEVGKGEAPRTIRQMIERNLERLKLEEQAVLEAASVAGVDFSATAVAAALQQEVSEVESWCARLARHQQFIAACGAATWPDGTVTANFRFRHALYSEVLYGRVPAGTRATLHRRIAERQEQAHGERLTGLQPSSRITMPARTTKLGLLNIFS